MVSSFSHFCDICGAALTTQSTHCSVCGTSVNAYSPSPPPVQVVTPPVRLSIPTTTGPLTPGSLLARRYSIISQIGSGGFGVVYKAKDYHQHRKLVAIKEINLRSLSPQEMIEATDSYNREVMHLSRLKHHSLPQIYDHFTDPDHWYVVMDFLEGQTLEDTLKKTRGGRLPLQKVLDIGIELCHVLHYLHSQRPAIIFRDVKPANVMQSADGHIYLIDFGIARRYTPGQAKDTGSLGSPGFAAPEQYGRAQTSVQTDIYGLGATLQTLLLGKDPLDIQLEGIPRGRSIPKKLQPLLEQMLERDPDKRPKSMEEVRYYLQYLKGKSRSESARQGYATIRRALRGLTPFIITLLLNLGLRDGPFYLPCLLTIAVIITGYFSMKLYEENRGRPVRLTRRETLTVMREGINGAILYAMSVSLIFYAFQLCLGSPFWPTYVFLGGILAIMAGVLIVSWLISRIKMSRARTMAQRRRQQRAQAPLQQQFRR